MKKHGVSFYVIWSIASLIALIVIGLIPLVLWFLVVVGPWGRSRL
ncbi:MAG: hypothetical protein NT154_04030 [Verrucomicrobia bacterium]|nr:hypothetical protein [Verrucomicrobiota bacterium]